MSAAAAAIAAGSDVTAGNWYQIQAAGSAGQFTTAGTIATVGDFSGNLGVGDLVYMRADITIAASTDDSLHLVTFDQIESVSGWNFGITRPEIDLTTIEDTDRVYRFGRNEWSGEINGVFDRDVTDLYSRVVKSIEFGTAAPATGFYEDIVNPVGSSEFPFIGVLDTGAVDGITFVFLEAISLGGYGFGATDGSRQEWTAPLRLTAGDYGLSPTIYHVKGVSI